MSGVLLLLLALIAAPARLPAQIIRLLKRVFDIDIEACPNCGGALKIVAAI